MATAPDDYVTNYLQARGALLDAEARLQDMSGDLSLDETEQSRAQFALLQMTEQIADLDAAHTVAKASYQPGVNPPSQELVDRSLDLATRLGRKIARARRAEAILEAVIQLTDAWKKVTA
ncbi:hypothetical protein [Ramlibacter sp. AN1133]|uniref:hypothetical protein n=1 Tax=Ramlibacter sp. AN1133 TaxID=3133429 RepID=UPI0030C175BD